MLLMTQNMLFCIQVNKDLIHVSFMKKRNNNNKSLLFSDDFTEDAYFMHEELLQELEAQYEVNKSIYEQIGMWNELFLEFQEFEV